MNDKINPNDILGNANLPEETKKKINENLNPTQNQNRDENRRIITAPSSYVEIKLHSLGKFSAPSRLHFKDYTTEQLSDLTLAIEDNFIENLVRILNENCFEDFDVGECTEPEFIEILATILARYWRTTIDVPWMCDCQREKMYEDERKIENYPLDLKQIVIYNTPDNVHEPIGVELENDNGEKIKYSFRFTRINDVIYAKKIIMDKYNIQQKQIQNFYKSNLTKDQIRDIQKDKQKELDKKKLKDVVLITRAQCLTHINDIPVSEDKKLKEFLKIDPFITSSLFQKMENTKIGFEKEYMTKCTSCGEEKLRRLLFQYLFFIPTDGQRQLGKSAVFTGI